VGRNVGLTAASAIRPEQAAAANGEASGELEQHQLFAPRHSAYLLFVHLDQRKAHYVKVIFDEVFMEQNLNNACHFSSGLSVSGVPQPRLNLHR
jgi:hypothetical protein